MILNHYPKTARFIGIAALLTAVFAGGYYSRGSEFINNANATASKSVSAPVPDLPKVAPVGLPDFSSIVTSQGPAVVNISVSGTVKTGFPGFPGIDPEHPFYDLFKHFQPRVPEGESLSQALGSGFIVNPDGVILTNAHVVADADEVTVKLTDKREFKAKVVGLDKLSDVAVLKIEAKDLPSVKIGNPQITRVGDWVVAIGSPFGFENTVTAGIVSAKSRALPDETYVPFLQTDVAINPGNSGGPLFNLNGEVIGINSQIFSRSGGYQGLSFAIPIDAAMKVEQQLLDHGKVSRGRLGVTIQPINHELAKSFGLDKPEGALVSSVEKGSPADKAGIEAGDVILKFEGKSIGTSFDLPLLVAEQSPGTEARLEVWHDGKAKSLSLRLAEMKAPDSKSEPIIASKGKLGLSVRPLSDEEHRQSDVDQGQGLVVESVNDGPAAKAGIRPGDILLAVNGEKITSVDQLRSMVEKTQKNLALLVMRGENKIFVPISIG
jgi:serine protease Do